MIYFLIEEDFGGLTYGLVETKEIVPAGAKTFESQAELDSAVLQAEKNSVKAFEKEQAEIENNSGTVVITTDTSVTSKDEAGAIVDANIFFQSGTTESEDYSDPTLSAQHINGVINYIN